MDFHVIIIILLGISLEICHSQPSAIDLLPRIIGGSTANAAYTKHQVSIRLKRYDIPFGRAHICGGSLIGPRKVLTAAHCVYNNDKGYYRKANEFIVVMGVLNRFERVNGTIVSEVTSITFMNTFNYGTLRDDVAVMFLKRGPPVTRTHLTVAPIALANTSLLPGTVCQVTGWGQTTDAPGSVSSLLLTANVSIIPHTICEKSYKLLTGMICAGNWMGGADSCHGDSGGPLVHNNVLVGIVSWGYSCGLQKLPGVYSDVLTYRKWIEAQNAGSILAWSNLSLVLTLISVYLLR